MTKSILLGLVAIGSFTAPVLSAEVSDLPDCLKPNRTLSSVSAPMSNGELIAQAPGSLDPACTYRVEQPPAQIEIRGLW